MRINLADKVFTLVGRRGCGKSEMLKHLIKEQKSQFEEIFVISPSSFSGFWDGVVPESNVMDEFKEPWVDALISKMTCQQRQNQGEQGLQACSVDPG